MNDDRARARFGGPMAQFPLTLRRWKRVEYERLVDLGVFERDRVELIGGQLVVAVPRPLPARGERNRGAVRPTPRRPEFAIVRP